MTYAKARTAIDAEPPAMVRGGDEPAFPNIAACKKFRFGRAESTVPLTARTRT